MAACAPLPHEPSSIWGEFFAPCAPQCADQCCGDHDHETQTNDDDLLHVYAFDDEHVSFNGDDNQIGPTIRQPAAAAHMRLQKDVPWANAESFGQVGMGFPSQTSSHGYRSAPANNRSRRAPSPSINPLSKFGFMTMTVAGSSYSADTGDVMDVEMSRNLSALDPEAASALLIRRLTPGKYEIDGRFVSVRWGAGRGSTDLFAKEDVGGEEELPVPEYLNQLAGLAREIRPPVAPRALTFPDEALEDRYESMQLACKQAKERANAAEACWQDGSSFAPSAIMNSKTQGVPAMRAASSASSVGVMPTFLRRLH